MELMDGTPYTELILGLPEIELPVPGAQGWLLQGEERQMAFFDLPEGGRIPLHSHGEQWGLARPVAWGPGTGTGSPRMSSTGLTS
jgi:hypothetical protein